LKQLYTYINKKGKIAKSVDSSFYDFFKKDTLFDTFLNKATDSYIKKGKYNNNLESIAINMKRNDLVLLLKRCNLVMGYCSQDQRPRQHALEIATLAGETQSWNIFMRAHLDIMNDRFVRMIDGSYAWNKRATYLKELEELNLNVVDLMLGMTLRASNTAPNHYNGTVWRLGKALAESKDQEKFQDTVLKILKDEKLDDFNRGLLFLLYNSYLNNIDVTVRNSKVAYLKTIQSDFPSDIKIAIEKLKEKKNDKENEDEE
jgi:hypothetical protein